MKCSNCWKKSPEMGVCAASIEFWQTTRSYISTTHFWSQAWSPISLACPMGIHITDILGYRSHIPWKSLLTDAPGARKKIFERRKSTQPLVFASWRIFYGLSLSNATSKSYRVSWNAKNDGLSIRQKGRSIDYCYTADGRVDRSSVKIIFSVLNSRILRKAYSDSADRVRTSFSCVWYSYLLLSDRKHDNCRMFLSCCVS